MMIPNSDNNVVFIGNFYPNNLIDEILQDNHKLDNAANTFQQSILKGFGLNSFPITAITLPSVNSFPKNNRIIYKSYINIGDKDISSLGFLNISLLKHFSKYRSLRKYLSRIIDVDKKYILVIYSVHSPFLKAVASLKKNNPNIRICLIVPDLPEFMSDNKNLVYRFLKWVDKKIINKTLLFVDSFVILTPYMIEKLPIDVKPYIILEGIYDETDDNIKVKKEEKKTILYSGSLSKRYGINKLLNAFVSIKNENYQLWLCGSGSDECIDLIKSFQSNDDRIHYFGMINKHEVHELQKRATLLINPRSSSEVYTKYSFPSKTMEYMASRTPTLMSNLDSLPNDYTQYLYILEDESVDGMRNKIIEICEKRTVDLDAFGKKASEFILNNKNSEVQTKKIINLINSL